MKSLELEIANVKAVKLEDEDERESKAQSHKLLLVFEQSSLQHRIDNSTLHWLVVPQSCSMFVP